MLLLGLRLLLQGFSVRDPGSLLQRLPFSELQRGVPSLITSNQQTQHQRDLLRSLHVDLIAEPMIGTPAELAADLLINAQQP